MASTSASRRAARAPAEKTVFPDEILEEIFLRLDAGDLDRVSATCPSFGSIIGAPRFLHRFRFLHSPPVLGFITRYQWREFLPVAPPHRSAPQARALAKDADFTFSFIPYSTMWRPCNACGGRVLLYRDKPTKIRNWDQDLIVCDPLLGSRVKIPNIPDKLLAACTPYNSMAPPMLPVLAPPAENDEESFRVICTVRMQLGFEDRFMAFVFSSRNNLWRVIISTVETACVPNISIEDKPYYAHGCFYWMVYFKGYSLMLDITEMKFSFFDLPAHNFNSVRAIVEAADGRLGFLTIGDGTINLYCKNQQSSGAEWQHANVMIPLPNEPGINYHWRIVGTTGRYVAFCGKTSWFGMRDNDYFVLDMKTLLVEKLCTGMYGFPYARFHHH